MSISALPSAALRASRSLERVGRLLRERESEAGLNPAQWDALRCLAAANRFSRTPSAVAAWIATTRGTASQTLMALERKGLVARVADTRDKRSSRLELTPAGVATMERDPVAGVASAIAGLQPLHAVALGQALARVLDGLLEGGRRPLFRACQGCRNFTPGEDDGGHCARFNAPLDSGETARACVAHVAA